MINYAEGLVVKQKAINLMPDRKKNYTFRAPFLAPFLGSCQKDGYGYQK